MFVGVQLVVVVGEVAVRLVEDVFGSVPQMRLCEPIEGYNK